MSYRVYSEYAGPRWYAGLKKHEDDAKKNLPKTVDDATTWVDVRYEPTKTTYWYVVDTSKIDMGAPSEIEQKVQQGLCANAEALRTIREKGFSYEYHYDTKAGGALAHFTITTCP